jgi:hypothetical protein
VSLAPPSRRRALLGERTRVHCREPKCVQCGVPAWSGRTYPAEYSMAAVLRSPAAFQADATRRLDPSIKAGGRTRCDRTAVDAQGSPGAHPRGQAQGAGQERVFTTGSGTPCCSRIHDESL